MLNYGDFSSTNVKKELKKVARILEFRIEDYSCHDYVKILSFDGIMTCHYGS